MRGPAQEHSASELELELIQPHMTQKPVLRGEVDAHALRVSSVLKSTEARRMFL